MSSYRERVEFQERVDRTVKRASSYLRTATDAFLPNAKKEGLSMFPYFDLAQRSIDSATEIVDHLPDDYFDEQTGGDAFGILAALGADTSYTYTLADDLADSAQKLVAALDKRASDAKRRRRIKRLENVKGRTPGEAASYLAKAEELRRGQG